MISLTIFCFLLKVAGMFRDNSIGKIKVTYVVSRLMIITNKEVLAQAVTYFSSVAMNASHSTKITVWNFGNSTYQRNGTLRLHRPDPSHRTFGYCSCKQDTKERHWGQQFCQLEKDISVWPNGQSGPPSKLVPNIPVGPNRSGQFYLISNQNIRNFGLNGKRPMSTRVVLAWDKSRYFTALPLVSPRNDVWETSAEIPYWWPVTNQFWIILLIGRAAWQICFNQSEALTRSG